MNKAAQVVITLLFIFMFLWAAKTGKCYFFRMSFDCERNPVGFWLGQWFNLLIVLVCIICLFRA